MAPLVRHIRQVPGWTFGLLHFLYFSAQETTQLFLLDIQPQVMMNVWPKQTQRFKLALSFTAFMAVCLFAPLHLRAQDPVGGAEQPGLGTNGHEYIRGLNDTVDPSTGALSLRFQISLPRGRGLNIPFSINYGSNGVWRATPRVGPWTYGYYGTIGGGTGAFTGYGVLGLSYGGLTGEGNTDNPSWTENGWSYPIPKYSFIDNIAITTGENSQVCTWASDYEFYDPSGGGHSLQLGYASPGPAQNACNVFLGSQGQSFQTYSVGGDNEFRAAFSTNSPITPIVAGLDGTTYSFTPALGTLTDAAGAGHGSSTHYGLASQIEDRNGNLISVVQNGGSVTYKDTLQRNSLTISSFSAPTDTVSVSGINSPYQISWAAIQLGNTQPNFPNFTPLETSGCIQGNNSTTSSGPEWAVSTISLPNGDSYQFSYDAVYGLVNKVIYPTGAWVSYKWGPNPQATQIFYTSAIESQLGTPCHVKYDTPAVLERDISYDGTTIALKQIFTYTTSWPVNTALGWTSKTTTITDIDQVAGTSSVTTYSYLPGAAPVDLNTKNYVIQGPNIPVETTVQYGSHLTKSEVWSGDPADKKVCEVDTLDGQSSGIFTSYASFSTSYEPSSGGSTNFLGEPTEVRVYDVGSVSPSDCLNNPGNWPQAAPLTDTIMSYKTFATGGNPAYPLTWLPNLPTLLTFPSSVSVTGSGGNQSITTYGYDETPVVAIAGATAPPPGSTSVALGGHDETNYSSNSVRPRANVTSMGHLISNSAYSTTSYTYDEDGNQLSIADANGNSPTVLSYGPYPVQVTSPSTNGVAHQVRYQYDNSSGLLTGKTDENGQTTNYFHDPIGRVAQVASPPINGQTPTSLYSYTDGPSPSTTFTDPMGSKTESVLDGFGRALLTITGLTDPTGPIYQMVTYDGHGRVYKKWNPSRCNLGFTLMCPGETTFGFTQNNYDDLGRLTSMILPDGSQQSWSYNANATTFTNPLGVQTKTTKNTLGQLTSITENLNQNSSSNCGTLCVSGPLTTLYTYDALGNLTNVNQKGGIGDVPRTRLFSYDASSRLTSATNPETGTVSYTYDPNGNMITKTDARGVVTSYTYDQLNRLTFKSYSGLSQTASQIAATTPPSTFIYDVMISGSVPNAVGRLVNEYTGPATMPFTQHTPLAYDAAGNLTQDAQCATSGGCAQTPYQLQYLYDLDNRVTYSSNGASAVGIGLTYGYDPAGRLATVNSTWDDVSHPATLLAANNSSASSTWAYDPMGHLTSAQLAVGSQQPTGAMLLSRQYDNEGRTISEQAAANKSFGAITIQGQEQSIVNNSGSYATLLTTIPSLYYQCGGTVNISFNNSIVASAPYSLVLNGAQTLPASAQLATVIYNALNVPSSPVSVQMAGTSSNPYYGQLSLLQLTSKIPGSAGNYVFSFTVQQNGASCGAGSGTLSGGVDSSSTLYDSGTISVSRDYRDGGISVSWGQGDDVQSVLSNLGNAIQSTWGYATNINGNTLSLTADPSGQYNTSPLNIGVNDTANFPNASFTATASGMSVSANAPYPIYAFSVPQGGYDAAGNLQSVADSVIGNWSYSYDNLNRLVTATASTASYMGSIISGSSLNWSYDSFGNRLFQNTNNSLLPSGSVQYAGPSNRALGIGLSSNQNASVTTFQYDESGNPIGQNGNPSNLFDAEGRLCATTNGTGGYMQYLYDAEGRRVAKGSINSLSCDPSSNQLSETNQYLLGLDGRQITELDGQGNWLRSNVFASGELLATYDTTGLHYHFSDWLGTRRIQASPTGYIEETCQSFPFGDGLSCNGADSTELHFTGKERDAESGLDYFGARYYASSMGRFSSPDPQGNSYADFSNPQSWNMYSYVVNNPLKYTDPTGLYCYYGDPNSISDGFDQSQYDFHSSSGECTKADENGNKGQWIDDAYTHGGFDDAGRPEEAVSGLANASTTPQPTAGEAWNDLKTTIPGLEYDVLGSLLPSSIGGNQNSFYTPDLFRLFGTHYCGPGGGGATQGALDPACKVHDACYGAAPDGGISAGNNMNPMSPMNAGQVAQAKQCNQALYDAARNHPDAPGSKAVQWWMVNGSHLPGGAYILFPGTEAKPW